MPETPQRRPSRPSRQRKRAGAPRRPSLKDLVDVQITAGLVDIKCRMKRSDYVGKVMHHHILGEESIFLRADYGDSGETNTVIRPESARFHVTPADKARNVPMMSVLTVKEMQAHFLKMQDRASGS